MNYEKQNSHEIDKSQIRNEQSQEYEVSEDEQPNYSLSFEVDQTCTTRIRDKMRKLMITPENKKLRLFHVLLALIFYIDIIITSLLMGLYTDDKGNEERIGDELRL